MEQTIEMKTNFCMHETHFKWAIEDWDKVYQRTGCIRSEDFTLKGLDAKVYFMFHLDVNEIDRIEPVLGVFIEHNQPFLCPDVNAYVIKLENIKTSMIEACVHGETKSMCNHMFILPDEHNIQELYIVNNTLNICCDIKYYVHINKVKGLSDLPLKGLITASQEKIVLEKETVFTDESESSDGHSNESSDVDLYNYAFGEYVKLFKESKLCDVTFVFKLEEVRAHRIILSGASPYFSRKFIKERAHESEDYRIDCTRDKNLSPSILRCFLEYLYGIQTFDDLRSSIGVTKLYILAKKYKMDRLKMVCKYYMRKCV